MPQFSPSILLLRSEARTGALRAALAERGIEARCLPLQCIVPVNVVLPDPLPTYQGMIYTSVNAVRHGPDIGDFSGTLAAVGPTTAAALAERFDGRAAQVPDQGDSEGLLALPVLQAVKGQRWLLVTGRQGRGLLQEGLRQRGASLDVLEVYAREPINPPQPELEAALGDCELIAVFNGESLSHLNTLCQGTLHNLLLGLQLVVPSMRVVKMAEQQGFRQPAVSVPEMTDAGMLATILHCLGDGKDKARTIET